MSNIVNNSTSAQVNKANTLTTIQPKVSDLGKFLCAYAAQPAKSDKPLTLTVKCMVENGVSTAVAESVPAFAESFYKAVATMMSMRESSAKEYNYNSIKAAENHVRCMSDQWFKLLGTREPKEGETEKRGLYTTRFADSAIYGEMVNQSLKSCKNSVTAAPKHFLEHLALAGARIINGESLSRISDADIKATKEAFTANKAAKSAETKEKNKTEAQKTIEEKEAKIAELETFIKENSINLEKAIALIAKSHATDEEKVAICAALDVKGDKVIETAKAE